MKNIYLFLILTIFYLISSFLFQRLLMTDDILYNFYSEQLANEQIEALIENQKKWEWFGYILIPLIILIRACLVAFCLEIGLFFYNSEKKHQFKQLLNISLIAEFILFIASFSKLIYFSIIETDFTYREIQLFHPLSFTNLIDIENLESWLIYPLQTINLFEIIYCFVLVSGLKKLLEKNYWKSFEIVTVSYGTGLTIWIALVVFFTLNFS